MAFPTKGADQVLQLISLIKGHCIIKQERERQQQRKPIARHQSERPRPFLRCAKRQTEVEESERSKVPGKIKSQAVRDFLRLSVIMMPLNKESNPESLLVKIKKQR